MNSYKDYDKISNNPRKGYLMKKILLISMSLLVLFMLSGCSSVAVGFVGSDSSGKMSGSYFKLNGTRQTKLTVDEGETVDISVNIVTKKGTIDVFIYKDEDDYAYEGHDIGTKDFHVTLTEPGKYTIKVVTEKHRGSYKFTW